MFEVRITKNDNPFTSTMFDTLEEAVKYFQQNDKLGFMCALYNFK